MSDVKGTIRMRRARRPGRSLARGARFLVVVLVVEAGAFRARAHDDGERPSREVPSSAPTNATAGAAPKLRDPNLQSQPAKVHRSPWPFALIGVGALTLGAGAWLAYRDNQGGTPMCTVGAGGHTTCPYATSTQWEGWALVGIGAQLAAAGIIWRIVEARPATTTLSLAAGPGTVGLIGTF
jgi:hypothetical protein